MGSTAEQTLIGFISVDNNAQRLCNLRADLPEERLNGKIPALKPASLFCSTPSVWTPKFLAECHCVHSIMSLKMWGFQLFSSYWNKISFSDTFLWSSGISAIKSTCSHCMVHLVLRRLGKRFEFSPKWNFEWLLSNKKTHFLVTLEHFLYSFIQTLKVCWSNEPDIARQGKISSPSFVLYLRELQYVKKAVLYIGN